MLERASMAAMRGMKSFGRYGSLGLELLISMGIGYYGGAWIDRKLGTHWFALVGFLMGGFVGFRSIFRAAKQMERDIVNDERLERGEDPWAPPEADDSEPEILEPPAPKATHTEEAPPHADRTK